MGLVDCSTAGARHCRHVTIYNVTAGRGRSCPGATPSFPLLRRKYEVQATAAGLQHSAASCPGSRPAATTAGLLLLLQKVRRKSRMTQGVLPNLGTSCWRWHLSLPRLPSCLQSNDAMAVNGEADILVFHNITQMSLRPVVNKYFINYSNISLLQCPLYRHATFCSSLMENRQESSK